MDNLGKIFSEGIKDEDFDLPALSHLSHMLNLFFKVYLYKICAGDLGEDENGVSIEAKDLTRKNYKKSKGRNVSIIYAGGDDLFIVGAWNEVVELSYDIQRCFKRFSGLGISCGLTLHKPKYPLYQMARMSGEAESFAKEDISHNNEYREKNRMALFYDTNKRARRESIDASLRNLGVEEREDRYRLTVLWEEMEEFVIPLVETFIELGDIKNNHIQFHAMPSAFIEKLFMVAEEWQIKGHLYIAVMSRVLDQARRELMPRDFESMKNLLYAFSMDNIKKLHIPLTWISYLRR